VYEPCNDRVLWGIDIKLGHGALILVYTLMRNDISSVKLVIPHLVRAR
jgi:hypothetical protein